MVTHNSFRKFDCEVGVKGSENKTFRERDGDSVFCDVERTAERKRFKIQEQERLIVRETPEEVGRDGIPIQMEELLQV